MTTTHDAKVEYSHLWSYAQQAALVAVCDKNNLDGRYHLIADPERRAKRIAGHYAALYFDSAKKSNKKVQFYWPALAAFVVKDIVEAYRFAREEVMHREWKDVASVARNSALADLGSLAMTNDSPYQHVLRTYSALAKGNLWLFMDIYPWLWCFKEYGINADGSLNRTRLDSCLAERNWNTFRKEAKIAIEELPFGPNWMGRLATRLKEDNVFNRARQFFDMAPDWTAGAGYGRHTASAYAAHQYCRSHVKDFDGGYRTPPSSYWGMNHRFSRLTDGWLSPKFKVVHSSKPTPDNAEFETVFDAPASLTEQFFGKTQSLPNADDRVGFVKNIAKDFDRLMSTNRPYMDRELQKIAGWTNS